LDLGQVQFGFKMLILNQIEWSLLEIIDQVQSLFCNIFYFQSNHCNKNSFSQLEAGYFAK